MPCYLQLTILLPIILGLYYLIGKQNTFFQMIFLVVLYSVSIIGAFLFSYFSNVGGTIIGIP